MSNAMSIVVYYYESAKLLKHDTQTELTSGFVKKM